MQNLYYPSRGEVEEAMKDDDPLLALIAHDGAKMLLAPIDQSFEHLILLKQLGFPETDIGKYFRLVVNKTGADWTFVCPPEYRAIRDKQRRIGSFFNDGFKIIPRVLKPSDTMCPLKSPSVSVDTSISLKTEIL